MFLQFDCVSMYNAVILEGSGIDVRMMCGVTAVRSAQHHSVSYLLTTSLLLSPFTVSSVMCPRRRDSVLFFLSVVIVQLSESTTTLCSLPPIILPMYIPMTLPSLTFLQQ